MSKLLTLEKPALTRRDARPPLWKRILILLKLVLGSLLQWKGAMGRKRRRDTSCWEQSPKCEIRIMCPFEVNLLSLDEDKYWVYFSSRNSLLWWNSMIWVNFYPDLDRTKSLGTWPTGKKIAVSKKTFIQIWQQEGTGPSTHREAATCFLAVRRHPFSALYTV